MLGEFGQTVRQTGTQYKSKCGQESGMSLEIRQFLMGSDNFGILVHDHDTGATASIDAGASK
jgi:hypothetical protein